MEKFVAKKFAQRYLSRQTSGKDNSDNFFYIQEPVLDRHGRETGKIRKTERPPPPGLTKDEKAVLKTVMSRAKTLDNSFNIGGIRVGWGAIFGIIPFVGDFFDTLMALWVMRKAQEVDLPDKVRGRMLVNVVIDFVIGLVPFIGDLGDALFRANTMNAALLYETLRKRGESRIAREEHEAAAAAAARGRDSDPLTRPEPTKSKSGGYLQRFNPFGASSKAKQPDPERADVGDYEARVRDRPAERV